MQINDVVKTQQYRLTGLHYPCVVQRNVLTLPSDQSLQSKKSILQPQFAANKGLQRFLLVTSLTTSAVSGILGGSQLNRYYTTCEANPGFTTQEVKKLVEQSVTDGNTDKAQAFVASRQAECQQDANEKMKIPGFVFFGSIVTLGLTAWRMIAGRGQNQNNPDTP